MPEKNSNQFKNFDPYEPAADEEYMSEAQQNHFRDILNQWRKELMHEVDRTVSHMKDEALIFLTLLTEQLKRKNLVLSFEQGIEKENLKKIESTLEAIDNYDYGFCDSCGIEIGIRRLEARPTAAMYRL